MTCLDGYLSPSVVLLDICPSWYGPLLVDGCVGLRTAAMLRAAEKTSLPEKLAS